MTALHSRNRSSEIGPMEARKGAGSADWDWSSLSKRFVAGGEGVLDIFFEDMRCVGREGGRDTWITGGLEGQETR